MSKRDYYETLGVSKNASEADIKKAYRRLAMKHHPDRNPGDAEAEAKFKEAQDAWDVLSDSQKRAAYDQFGHAGVGGAAGGGGHGGFGGGGQGGFGDIFGDVFGDMFGGGGGRGGQQQSYRGADLRYELEIDLEEAVFGAEKTIKFPTRSSCDSCHGNGCAAGSSPQKCGTCNGVGQVRMQQGFFSVQQTCPNCRGRGEMITNPCSSCHGSGQVRKTKTLQVKIPAGVDTGDRIRLSGEGEPGERSGPAGDLFVEMVVREHSLFTRDGDNLHCDIPISFATAALGGEIEVPTLGGRVTLKVPPETQSGKVFRLRGKGVKSVRSSVTGDLYCRTAVEVPVNLTREQRESLEQFDSSLQEGGKRHSPQSSSFFDGVKSFFDRF